MGYIKSHVKKSIFINAPVEKVSRYLGTPENWAQFHDNLSGIKPISGKGGLGSVFKADYAMAEEHGPVEILITQSDLAPEGFILKSAVSVDTMDPAEDSYVRQSYIGVAKENGTEFTFEEVQNVPIERFGGRFDKESYQALREKSSEKLMETIKKSCEA
ncbi:polyketide cyclase / dehydrase and lipid transport [Trichococcus palustris]|jgi:hypothetical protein|uniref:Polyketide cyclase / dehydrase and lipid transport n=1 Tax=Trichococcus palustris TaxID=140314 RepID=A0A143YGB5_9LACT|nr:SRPBCC family protein [Trichococcus palustris]CZQ90019.1 polyketide cyclase / dehydrase and lipid transport [Trichococcus palustris]SFK98960.1 hypothetical protein SAMN04488076_11248 [Trichococcus palustris]